MQLDANPGLQWVFGGNGGDSANTWFLAGFSNNPDEVNHAYFRATGSSLDLASNVLGAAMIGSRQGASALDLYYRGALKASAPQAGNPLVAWNNPRVGMSKSGVFGSDQYSQIHLLELMAFREALSDATIAETWQYLATKYALPIDSAPDHADLLAFVGRLHVRHARRLDVLGPRQRRARGLVVADCDGLGISLRSSFGAELGSPSLTSHNFTGLSPRRHYYAPSPTRTTTGAWATFSAVDSFTTTAIPTNTQPDAPTLSHSALTATTVTLTGSAFSDPDPGDGHLESQWQVATDAGFASLVEDVTSGVDLVSHDVTGLTQNTAYYARLRYRDDSAAGVNEWSDWSASDAFSTPANPPDAVGCTASNVVATSVRVTPAGPYHHPDGEAQVGAYAQVRRAFDDHVVATVHVGGAPAYIDVSGLYGSVELVAYWAYEGPAGIYQYGAPSAAFTTPNPIGPDDTTLTAPALVPPVRVSTASVVVAGYGAPADIEADQTVLAAHVTPDAAVEADQIILAAFVTGTLPNPCPLEWFDVTFYADDDLTPLIGTADVDGNPIEPSFTSLAAIDGGVRPYLDAPATGPDESIDPVTCAGRVSQLNIRLLDKRTDPCDQTTGVLTALLPTVAQLSQLIGRRALVRRLTSALQIYYVIDGVVAGISLNKDLVSYSVYIKDRSERVRKRAFFSRNNTISVFPQGLTDGYGWIEAMGNYLMPAVDYATGTVRADPFGAHIEVTGTFAGHGITETMLAASSPVISPDDNPRQYIYPSLRLRWRLAGGEAWNYVDGSQLFSSLFAVNNIRNSPFERLYDGGPLLIELWGGGLTAALDGQAIEFQLLYNGSASEDWPYFWDGGGIGDLYKAALDGVFTTSGDPLGIEYDAAALTALNVESRRIRFIEDGVASDGLQWIVDNINTPFNILPVLDTLKRLAPIYGEYSPNGLAGALDVSNMAELAGDWGQDDSDSVGEVQFTYYRESIVPFILLNPGVDLSQVDVPPVWKQWQSQRVIVDEIDASTASLIRSEPLKIEPSTVRVAGTIASNLNPEIVPVTTETNEWAYQLAVKRAQLLLRRFAFGAQKLEGALAKRDDALVNTLKPGQWVSVDLPWIPNYATGQRGGALVAQVLALQDSQYWARSLGLVLSGFTSLDQLAQPVVDSVVLNGSDQLDVTISSIPAGAHVIVEYALSDTQPGDNWPWWRTLGESPDDTVPVILTSGILPSGESLNFWVRARSEETGRIASTWVYVGPVVGPAHPVLYNVAVFVDDDTGAAVVIWLHNGDAIVKGVRVEYEVNSPGVDPSYPNSRDVDANSYSGNDQYGLYNGRLQLPAGLVGNGQALYVRVTPYTEYPIGGEAGNPVTAYDLRGGGAIAITAAYVLRTADGACDETSLLRHTIHWSIENSYPAVASGLQIERSVDGGPWTVVVSGESAADTLDSTWDDVFPPGVVHDTVRAAQHGYIYRISVVRSTDGATVALRVSDEVLTNPFTCAEGTGSHAVGGAAAGS